MFGGVGRWQAAPMQDDELRIGNLFGGDAGGGLFDIPRAEPGDVAGADVVVMLHPDYQYAPAKVPELVEPLLAGRADFTFGSRFADGGRRATQRTVWCDPIRPARR